MAQDIWPGASQDACGVVLLQVAVALAGDDDGRVWWPAVAQDEPDQLAMAGRAGRDAADGVVLLQAAVALAGDDDGRV